MLDVDPTLPSALGALGDALRRRGVAPGQLEASVRLAADGALRGDRMMIERPPDGVVDDLLQALGVSRTPLLDALESAGHGLGLPSIAGWDHSESAVKFYVNASDASLRLRQALAGKLGLAEAAHVVGINLRRSGGHELKVYVQSADPLALASRAGAAARGLAERGMVAGLCAGAVLSHDVRDREIGPPRAFFLALRASKAEQIDEVFGMLDRWSWSAIRAASPFEPASPNSVGIACVAPFRWTAYLRPRGAAQDMFTIEPIASFRCDQGQVAVYVEPDREAVRAFARVSGLAVSYRVAEGAPAREPLELLLQWVVARLSASPTAALVEPPSPWRRVP